MTKKSKSKKNKFFPLVLFIVACVPALGLVATFLASHINPASLWAISLSTFFFPSLLLINIGFAIFYLFTNYKRSFLFIAVILLNIGQINVFFQFRSLPFPKEKHENLKLLTYNVNLFDYYTQKKSEFSKIKNEITDFICEEDADIVCFQEYYESRNSKFNIRRKLSQKGNLKYVATYTSNAGFYFGNAIYSKYPIVNKGEVYSPCEKYQNCVFADIKYKDQIIRVYNMHLESNKFNSKDHSFFQEMIAMPHEKLSEQNELKSFFGKMKMASVRRSKQMENILNHIKQANMPCILMGDMNEIPISYCYQQTSDILVDGYNQKGNGIGATYRGIFPSFRIDYILFTPNLTCSAIQRKNVDYSDHSPLIALLTP